MSAEASFCRMWLAWSLLTAAGGGEALKSGQQILTYTSQVDDSQQPYAVYVPKNYDPARKYPVVISLHNLDWNHRLSLRTVFGRGSLPGEAEALKDVDFIVAAPQDRGTMGYQGIAERDIYDVLADVKGRFSVDEDRVYLTGLSTGGGGALWLALTRPDVWAAVAVVCPTPPPGLIDLAPNALNLPMRIYHGAADPIVSAEISRAWVVKLRELDTRVEYFEYPNVRHNSWDNAYKDGAIFTWFSQFRRNKFPDAVRLVSSRYRHSEAYWVRMDRLTPGVEAFIDAKFPAPNRVEVFTRNLDGFTLALEGHPKYSAAKPLTITIDGKRVVRRGKPLTFSVRGKDWINVADRPLAGAKHRGLEGPLAEAIAGRHIYVYGTADHPGEDEIKVRRDRAVQAADWSVGRARLPVPFRVLADREVKAIDSDRANLILFGGKETNSLIAEIAGTLPLELNAGAADYGLTYIFPRGRRYVLISSGRPWWTGAEFAHRPGLGRFPAPFSVLASFGDYVVFKGSLENVVAEGSFDPYWKLPPADAEKIEATGAVRIHD